MFSFAGISTFFISVWIIKATISQHAPDAIGVVTTECRITGIALFTGKNVHRPPFDFIEAQEVCKQLGLVLAHKSQIENALKHGFETCSFGWVAEGFTVISRITSNSKCGQGKTGVARWNIDHKRKSNAYCFNSSDAWINSCIPEGSTTALPDNSTEMNSTSTVTPQETSAMARTSEAKQTKGVNAPVRVVCVTVTISAPKTTTYEEEEITLPMNQAAFRNEGVIFGGIPTALLVLALIFFVAAVVLGVCYIKTYKKTFPFPGKEEKSETIETNDIKETKPSGKTSAHELKKNGTKAEEPQAKPEPSVKCMEAEV